MKKFIALALVVCFFLISAFPAAAELTEVSISRVTYSVYAPGQTIGSANITSTSGNTYATYSTIDLSTPSGLTAANLIRFEGNFLAGAEYTLSYVLYDPDAVYDSSSSAILHSVSTGNIQYNLPTTRVAFSSDPSLITKYPNPFAVVSGITDAKYEAGAYLFTVNFKPEYDDLQVEVSTSCYYNSSTITVGSAYATCKTTYEEANFWFLEGIYHSTSDILSFLTGYIHSTLIDINTALTNGFATLHSDLSNLTAAVGQGLQMTEEDEEDFSELESDQESFSNSAAQQQQQQNAALQQQQSANQDMQNEVNDLKDQEDHFNEVESDFKESYGDSADFKDINASINDELTGEYGAAIIWWGEVFGALFSFAPLTFMLNVAVFFSLLMLLFGVGTRSALRVSARERRAADRASAKAGGD